MPTLKQNKSQKQDKQKENILYLTALYQTQKAYGDPAAQNTLYEILAEENKVHDISSLIMRYIIDGKEIRGQEDTISIWNLQTLI